MTSKCWSHQVLDQCLAYTVILLRLVPLYTTAVPAMQYAMRLLSDMDHHTTSHHITIPSRFLLPPIADYFHTAVLIVRLRAPTRLYLHDSPPVFII